MRSSLRLFNGEDHNRVANEIETGTPQLKQAAALKPVPQPQAISVRLGDVLEPLADAIRSNRAFLKDFADDQIVMSSDLYEILTAFYHMRASA